MPRIPIETDRSVVVLRGAGATMCGEERERAWVAEGDDDEPFDQEPRDRRAHDHRAGPGRREATDERRPDRRHRVHRRDGHPRQHPPAPGGRPAALERRGRPRSSGPPRRRSEAGRGVGPSRRCSGRVEREHDDRDRDRAQREPGQQLPDIEGRRRRLVGQDAVRVLAEGDDPGVVDTGDRDEDVARVGEPPQERAAGVDRNTRCPVRGSTA